MTCDDPDQRPASPSAGQVRATRPADRLDAVQIKVTLGGRITETLKILGLPADGRHGRVSFCEQPTTQDQPCALPLTDSGVILRLRHDTGRSDQSTVELRPCRRSRLTDAWLAFYRHDQHELRIHADWAGERKVLAASLTCNLGHHKIRAVLAGQIPLRQVFSPTQRRFLDQCADIDVRLNALRVLGTVQVARWAPTRWQVLDVTAERWQLTDTEKPLDLLELSLRVEPQGAEIAQHTLDALLRQHHLDSDVFEGTKTREVLNRLTGQASRPP